MSTVVVTGGAGFVGSHVAELFRDRGHEVTVVDDLSSGKRENVPEGCRLVELDITDAPIEPPIAVAAYYIVSEALTNVAKYADASRAAVRVRETGDKLVVVVEDDGRGGADPFAGSGLPGLGDRVAALDGTLFVDSPKGAGTRIRAELPLS